MYKKTWISCCLLLFLLAWTGCEGKPGSSHTAGEAIHSARTESHAEQERTIVAFGDSLTSGLGVAADEAYPAVLERKIKEAGYPYRVVNAGVSGETTAGGLRRVDWVIRSRPDIVILELGANDGLRGLDPTQIEKNLSMTIELLRKKNIQVILAGMKIPPNYGKAYGEAFEKIFPRLAERYRVRLIPFFLDGVAAQTELNQADGLHPTAQGYQIIVDRLWPILEPILERRPDR